MFIPPYAPPAPTPSTHTHTQDEVVTSSDGSGGVKYLLLNRPKALNSLNLNMTKIITREMKASFYTSQTRKQHTAFLCQIYKLTNLPCNIRTMILYVLPHSIMLVIKEIKINMYLMSVIPGNGGRPICSCGGDGGGGEQGFLCWRGHYRYSKLCRSRLKQQQIQRLQLDLHYRKIFTLALVPLTIQELVPTSIRIY